MNFIMRPVRFIKPDVTLAYLQATTDESNLTTYPFSTVNLGSAGDDRTIGVAAYGEGVAAPRTISGITIGGTSATIYAQTNSSNNNWPVGLASLKIAAGATADIVVTFSGSMVYASIAVWDVRNGGVISDTATSIADPLTGTMTIQAGGGCIGAAHQGGGVATYTWTNLTEDFDQAGGTGNSEQITGASDVFATLQTDRVVSADPTGGTAYAGAFISIDKA